MIKIDGKGDLKAIERLKCSTFIAFFHQHLPLDADKTLGGILLFNTGRLDQEYKGPGTTIHDRYLSSTYIYIGIINTQTSTSGK